MLIHASLTTSHKIILALRMLCLGGGHHFILPAQDPEDDGPFISPTELFDLLSATVRPLRGVDRPPPCAVPLAVRRKRSGGRCGRGGCLK